MDVSLILVLFLIGFIGAYISGMVGIGGSIIKYPMLLYLPPLFGLITYTPHEVAGISAIQVLFSSISGVWAYRKSEYLNKELILYMGIAVLIGSFVGGFGSNMMPERTINLVYAILATVAAVMMFIPKRGLEDVAYEDVTFHKSLAMMLALLVGVTSGIVGAAGGFIIVPIMLVVLKIPTRMTVASSLAITLISSLGSTVGKVVTNQVLYGPAIVMILASIIGAQFGVKHGKKMNTKILQAVLAVLIFATAVNIWLDLLT